MVRSLEEVGFRGAVDLLATYAGEGSHLQPWLKGAEINRDGNLRLQYLAGMGLNNYLEKDIFDQILSYRTFPEDLFVASATRKEALRRLLDRPLSND